MQMIPENKPLDQVEITEVTDRLIEAWNRHHAQDFAALFSTHAEWIDVLGQVGRGPAEIEQRHALAFSSVLKQSTLTIHERHMTELRPDVALVRLVWESTGDQTPGGKPVPARHGLLTMVMTKEQGHWLVVSGHNTDNSAMSRQIAEREPANNRFPEITAISVMPSEQKGEETLMKRFTAEEITYLQSQRLGRLATVNEKGDLHVVPVGFRYNPVEDAIDIGGHYIVPSRKYREALRHGRVAFVVDDVLPPWKPRFVEVRGTVQAFPEGGKEIVPDFGPDILRVTPTYIVSMGINDDVVQPEQRQVHFHARKVE
jgi:pyridoxamine 5'-phosphate oxidase family protein